ncbi:GNAT family N-acetyltransferase [Clostridium sp. CF012]|uniref:GNAT family N-acetyltransferase n=1 Tax=Clostridium sp. CF012 TaxID=2843319 RepID=UPI001C0C176D|nr:GNAT family protein [Clostridium sp. CF012]MBU3146745.1 GNAT family N-acetyltransferase [Clostridium sp. CF012]
MEDIIIRLLEEADIQELFKFEIENRAFFERMGFDRGDSYYEINNFNAIIKALVEEQENGLAFMYLIRDYKGKIIGRVNLVSVVRGSFNKAELGYRIGEDYQGRGYATKAVNLAICEAASKHKLHRVEAGTSPYNIGSQIVLVKNGFQFTGRNSKYIYKNGKWHDSIIFEIIVD